MSALTCVVDRTDLASVALSGTDVLRYLHAVCSQHTLELAPGDATQALLLSPKGKIEFAFRLAVLEDGALLDTESATAAAGLPVPGPGRAGVATPDLVVHRTPVGLDLVGPGAAAAAGGLERAGVERAAAERWELARVAGGLPRAGQELTDDVLAEEAGLLGSHVHLDKGCYPGQETVARVHNLGRVQRRLAGLRFEPAGGDGERAPLPAHRTDLVTDDGRRAGQLRSVVDHPHLGPIGLAYVRRVVEDGRLVRAGDRVATVVALPFRDAPVEYRRRIRGR